ncbi:MAG TPA: hypothetical protein PK946_09970, partial [Tenuifilaceae bacterium]|nr:hypothetical protein [Tenuifilaceae bacterium]
PCGSNGASRSEYLLEAVPLRSIRLLPGHKSGQVTDAYTHTSQKNLQEIRSPIDELQKNYIYLFQMKFFYYCMEWKTQLYGAYPSKYGNKALWSGVYKRVVGNFS